MRVIARHLEGVFEAADWPADVLQRLDERHLVAWSDLSRRRNRFVATLSRFLAAQPDTEVCLLHGRSITSIEGLCAQLERQLPCAGLERRIDGPGGVTELLRQSHAIDGWRPARFRHLIWADADVLLRADAPLFEQVADAMIGIAAEAEYTRDGLLQLQRAVFVGGLILEEYARARASVFQSWLGDGHDEPFWQIVSGLSRPPVAVRPIEGLIRAASRSA